MSSHNSKGQLSWIIAAVSQVDVFDQSYFPVDRVLQRILSQSIHDMATTRRDKWLYIPQRVSSSLVLTIAACPRVLSRKAYRRQVLGTTPMKIKRMLATPSSFFSTHGLWPKGQRLHQIPSLKGLLIAGEMLLGFVLYQLIDRVTIVAV